MADHQDPDRDQPEDGKSPENPFEALFSSLGMGGPGQPDLSAMMNQFRQVMNQFGMGGLFGGAAPEPGAEWEPIRDVARRVVAAQGSDPSPTGRQLTELQDTVRLADTWLDGATDFPATGGPVAAWSRAEWVEHTMPTWRRLIEPVSEAMTEAMADSVAPPSGEAAGFGGLEGMLRPWLKSSGSTIFGLQAGQAIGALAGTVVSATETGLPLTGDAQHTIALVETNVTEFSEGLDHSAADVRLYLALRECARQRLFIAVPWLGSQLLTLVDKYARGITIDLSSLEDTIGSMDIGNLTPESMQEMSEKLQGSLFEPEQSPEQKVVLERLETLLALVEGWVDEVVAQATAKWMPAAVALAETVKRRRATSGPTEATFSALVGLELRPRRVRDAANLWAALRVARGAAGRDAVWKRPDLLPASTDLDDPLGYVSGERATPAHAPRDEMDAELERLLQRAEAERRAETERRTDEEGGGEKGPGENDGGDDDPGSPPF